MCSYLFVIVCHHSPASLDNTLLPHPTDGARPDTKLLAKTPVLHPLESHTHLEPVILNEKNISNVRTKPVTSEISTPRKDHRAEHWDISAAFCILKLSMDQPIPCLAVLQVFLLIFACTSKIIWSYLVPFCGYSWAASHPKNKYNVNMVVSRILLKQLQAGLHWSSPTCDAIHRSCAYCFSKLLQDPPLVTLWAKIACTQPSTATCQTACSNMP